jgi:hypothetical protein
MSVSISIPIITNFNTFYKAYILEHGIYLIYLGGSINVLSFITFC